MADRLTGLDASFLHLEGGDTHMHVAAVQIFAGTVPGEDELKDHIAGRLHLVPRFRQRVREVPLGQGRPVWVDDPYFNLDYHVRRTALPHPGDENQLRRLASRVMAQHLDRAKPLWEMWVIDGLEGDRWALMSKSHHCLVDGVSGVDLMTVLYDVESDPGPVRPAPEPWIPRPEPTDQQLLAEALLERATEPAEIVRGVRRVLRGPRQVAGAARDVAVNAAAMVGTTLDLAPSTPLNVSIGPHRRIALVRADLAAFKQIKNTLGGTVNDVVLAAVTGALARHLRSRGQVIDKLNVKAMVPVSIRTAEQQGSLGNQVTAMMASLPVWATDPIERLRTVSTRMGDLKESHQAEGAAMLTSLADFAPPTILNQAARLQSRQRLFNLVVTNVPGPQFPLYLVGRELIDLFPMVPLAKNQALCVGIMSYHGQINFGLLADYDAMPDLDAFADGLAASVAELAAAAGMADSGLRQPRMPAVTEAELSADEAHVRA